MPPKWKPPEDDIEEEKDDGKKIPVEPNGRDLTAKRASLEHTKAKMTIVKEEIDKLLQDEQRRQAKYKEDK